MAVHHGKNGKVKIGSAAVAAVQKFSVNQNIEAADTTVMGSDWQTHLVGVPGWSGSVECLYDPADTNGQVTLGIGDSVTLALYTDGDASGKKYLTGTASVTSIPIETDMKGAVKISFNIQGNGPLDIATVTP
ncbi:MULTISPECIES: hypothetical protein [unclassified Ensifer]|uniref:hypothetical protein n=1 Tax=unclassified Ensifer TaxID=2633371 RepID=UPI00070B8902|nr:MULTISPECIES: hypothetical protein [unclassified Ensifer]KQW62862.1 hypothetical protein ASD02_01700 [Ensifer sp. Root1252]KRC83683.1 hypothetical protein ASE32_01690 [Ensifer sp. Root231]KRD04036.1 hypothetical protein ASE47_00350 [Ensifer sp. Root258]